MQLDWTILTQNEAKAIITAVNPYLMEYALPVDSSPVRTTRLAFYQRYRLYELTDVRERQPKSMFALHDSEGGLDGTYVLDWTNRPIYTVNEHDPFPLRQTNMQAYLGFFFACVQGPYGPMTVVENLEPPDDADFDVQEMVAAIKTFCPPLVIGKTFSGAYIVKAAMLFKDCVFGTLMNVGLNGVIQIMKHELALGGLNDAEVAATKHTHLN